MKSKMSMPEKSSKDAINFLAINAKYSAEDKSKANQTGSDARLINNFSNLKENPDSWINGRTDRNVYGVGWEGSRAYDENTAKILKLQLVAINKETETVNKKSDSNSTKIKDYETKEETRKKKWLNFAKGAMVASVLGFTSYTPGLISMGITVIGGAINVAKHKIWTPEQNAKYLDKFVKGGIWGGIATYALLGYEIVGCVEGFYLMGGICTVYQMIKDKIKSNETNTIPIEKKKSS